MSVLLFFLLFCLRSHLTMVWLSDRNSEFYSQGNHFCVEQIEHFLLIFCLLPLWWWRRGLLEPGDGNDVCDENGRSAECPLSDLHNQLTVKIWLPTWQEVFKLTNTRGRIISVLRRFSKSFVFVFVFELVFLLEPVFALVFLLQPVFEVVFVLQTVFALVYN